MRLFNGVLAICTFLLLHSSLSLACQTRNLNLSGVLDSSIPATGPTTPITNAPWPQQLAASQMSAQATVHDSLGQGHAVDILFFHTSSDLWVARLFIQSEEVGGTLGERSFMADISLAFGGDGRRVGGASPDVVMVPSWSNGAQQVRILVTVNPISQLQRSSQILTDEDGSTDGCRQNALDFDGDGVEDFAIWRPTTGMWAVLKSTTYDTNNYIWVQWGLPGDYPMPGDYTGDGLADLVVYRIQTGMWYVCRSETGFNCGSGIGQQFGWPGDRPIRGDFDGDHILDFAVYRPSWLMFFYRSSRTGELVARQWGLQGDIPLTTGVNR